MKFLPVVLVVVLISTSLIAQSSNAVGEPPVLEDEIVVTASALPEDIASVPAAVTVITREEIDGRGARDLAEVLREVAGLQLARSGSAGKATSLFTRGSNSTHTLVLWNGIEINNPYFSGYDWGQFSTAGVDRVEVVRGPYSALYGSDAMAGVVQVFTAPTRSGFEVDLQAGERGLFNGRFGGSSVAGSFSIFGTAEHRGDDGWVVNDDLEQNVIAGGFRWDSSGISLGLTARYSEYDLGIPFNEQFGVDHLVPSIHRRQSGNEVQLAVPFELDRGSFRWNVDLSRAEHNIDLDDPDDPFGFTFGRTDSVTDRAGVRLTSTGRLGTVVVGGEFERAEVDDTSSFGVNLAGETRESQSLYVQERLARELGGSRLEISVGARWDDFDTFGEEVSPRVGLAWIVGAHTFRASWGEAFRAPSIGELYFPFSGNTELEAELSRSAEFGYDRSFGRGRLAVTLFHSWYDNLIFFDNLSFTFQNIGAATTEGVELTTETRLTGAWSAGLTYMWLDTKQDDTGEALLRRPQHSGSAHVRWSEGAYRVMATLVHSGTRADLMPVFPYSRITGDSWTTIDLGFSYEMGALEPYLKVENILDEMYEEVAGLEGPGRRAIVGLRYRQ